MRAATAMLANAAEVREGLLYVLGGGIEQLLVGEVPAEVAPTVVVIVDLDDGELGRPFTPHLRVESDAGDVLVDVDMPPAVPEPQVPDAGASHRFPMVFTVGMRVLAQGPHLLTVSVDGTDLAQAAFAVRLAGQPS